MKWYIELYRHRITCGFEGITYVKVICSKCNSISWKRLGNLSVTKSCGCRQGVGRAGNTGIVKTSKNKSGFVGVFLNRRGWECKIGHSGKITLWNRYNCSSDEAKLQAIIDRELFIIENNLPHYRNLTDEQLYKYIEERTDLEIKNITKLKKEYNDGRTNK